MVVIDMLGDIVDFEYLRPPLFCGARCSVCCLQS
jgi:hypothetical protein